MNAQAARVIRKLQKTAREWSKEAHLPYVGIDYKQMSIGIAAAYGKAARIVREEFKEGKE